MGQLKLHSATIIEGSGWNGLVGHAKAVLYILLLAGFALMNPVWGQTPTTFEVSGTVLETDEDGVEEPMALVFINIDSLKTGVASNMDGLFSIQLPNGKHKLAIRTIGYKPTEFVVEVKNAPVKDIIIRVPQAGLQLEEIVIRPGPNPAHRIIKNAIKNRDQNRVNNIPYYEYDGYNKTTVTLTNLSKKKIEKSIFLRPTRKFLLQNAKDSALIDTNQRYKLSVFVSEAISKGYYDRPDLREHIVAKQSTGKSNSETNLVTSLLANVDIYDNYFTILEKQFLSPIASGAFMNYNYVLVDTILKEDGDTIYGIEAIPKRSYDQVFKGRVYIETGKWAVQKADLSMNSDPNINFVRDVRIRQEFQWMNQTWLPVVKDVQVFFKSEVGEMGFVGRTATFMRNYQFERSNNPALQPNNLVTMETDAFQKDSTFWEKNRLAKLERSDVLAYEFVEDLRKQSIYQVILFVNEVLNNGKKRVGMFDIGPYAKVFGFNPVEGFRLQMGVYTNDKFSRRWYFGGHSAYGFTDQRWKYSAEAAYKFSIAPRFQVFASRTYEVDQIGFANYVTDGRGLLNSLLMRVPLSKLNYFNQDRIGVHAEIFKGVAGSLFWQNYDYAPAFPNYYVENGRLRDSYKTVEVGTSLRLSYRERYVIRKDERVYTGTNYPILYLDFRLGLKGFLGGEYHYQKLSATISNRLRVGRFGWMNYTATAGVINGTLPYSWLHVFQGSQSLAMDPMGYYLNSLSSYVGSNISNNYDRVTYNLMYFYEFVADRHLSIGFDHHFEGYVFNKIPGISWVMHKLKLKEVVTGRYALGSLSQANFEKNNPRLFEPYLNDPRIQANMDDLVRFKTPFRPYMEVGFGIENIFRLFRVDFLWRINYLDPKPPIQLSGYNYNFGIRIINALSF
jgi:hypothetical protein